MATPDTLVVKSMFECPAVGDAWQCRHVRGHITSAIAYVIKRSDDDWEARLRGPSGDAEIMPRDGLRVHASSWVPASWKWDDKMNRWQPPAKRSVRKTKAA